MNIRKTKPRRLSTIFYQRSHHLTHALSGLRGRAIPRLLRRDRPGKAAGQTIIKNYIDQRKEAGSLSTTQLLCFLKSPRIRKELDNSANRSIDTRLEAEYRYYRSRPSLALHMTREITRQLICYNPVRVPSRAAEGISKQLTHESREHSGENEKTRIVREEFMLTPQLLQMISEKAASRVFRSLELERLRRGL